MVAYCNGADLGSAVDMMQLHLAKLQAACAAGEWHNCESAFRAIKEDAEHGRNLATVMVIREREGGLRERVARL
ncbi:hypothetical protein [Gilvimarinus agarilyticus]|uniref:hypothetical protein n=1 Tax=Gilvimarinus agarilyticus TaxID=679259 RepID=UPI0005A16678|nr:hypothetical protein [Gilvimarinus agarilyticus]